MILSIANTFSGFSEFLRKPLWTIGGATFSILTIFLLLASLIILFWGSAIFKRFLINRAFKKYNINHSTSISIATFSRYLIIVLGLIIILQSSGINLSSLSILFGALGVGIGFGLQNITNNFISGIIILFEKPIKVGDRVVVGETEGQIVQISARATTIITNDNISIIVPNSEFVSSQVTNWSHHDESVRFKIPISVSYKSDVRLVERLLLEVAREDPNVLKDPAPGVRFLEFGDSGLLFELRAWSTSLMHRKGRLTSDLNFRIIEKFREHNIEIPFPQRDLNFKTGCKNLKDLQLPEA